jgi:hypothetical protein
MDTVDQSLPKEKALEIACSCLPMFETLVSDAKAIARHGKADTSVPDFRRP